MLTPIDIDNKQFSRQLKGYNVDEIEVNDGTFQQYYKERKELLSSYEMDSNFIISYCKKVTAKESQALYYLTDNTKIEKETIIKSISSFARIFLRFVGKSQEAGFHSVGKNDQQKRRPSVQIGHYAVFSGSGEHAHIERHQKPINQPPQYGG